MSSRCSLTHAEECVIGVILHIVDLLHSRMIRDAFMTEAVTVSNVIAIIASPVSAIWLATERQTDRQADRQAHMHAHMHARAHTHTHTHGLGYLP